MTGHRFVTLLQQIFGIYLWMIGSWNSLFFFGIIFRYLKGSIWLFFRDFRSNFEGDRQILEDKKKKFEIQQLACANLFKIILNSLFYSKKSTLMHSGAVEMRLEKKWTLIVHNCRRNTHGQLF